MEKENGIYMIIKEYLYVGWYKFRIKRWINLISNPLRSANCNSDWAMLSTVKEYVDGKEGIVKPGRGKK